MAAFCYIWLLSGLIPCWLEITFLVGVETETEVLI